MKKQQYIAPATKVVRIETMKMVAVSGMGINTNDADAVTDVDKLLSRRRSNLWDDEEEQ